MPAAPNAQKVSRHEIRRVAVILAGSRTGSSFLFRALNLSARFLSPTGEETPFYRKAGIGVFTGPHYSDAIDSPPPKEQLDLAGSLLLEDVGERAHGAVNFERLADAYFSRLELQWPGCLPEAGKAAARPALRAYLRKVRGESWRAHYRGWLEMLMAEGHAVEPSLLEASGPHPEKLALLEEPPYVAPEPMQALTHELAAELPLLLKTSTNAYRVPFLRALFPNAEFRWILLRRNPAAAVSALMDGWRSSGFHSHDVSSAGRLEIGGYSREVPGGDRFWKYDLPPGWQKHTRSPLAEVCAFQWQSAYAAIEEFHASTRDPVLEVRYESLLDAGSKREALAEIARFTGTSPRAWQESQLREQVMAVAPPQAGKWKRRAPEVLAALESSQGLRELAAHLHYPLPSAEAWP